MRCELQYDKNESFINQSVNAWGELQSLKEEPAYREEDIKDEGDRQFFRGYKYAVDRMIRNVENIIDDQFDDVYCDGIRKAMDDLVEELKSDASGDICMLLFSILDNQECEGVDEG